MELATYIFTPLIAFTLAMIFIPIARNLAFKIKLVDKPNARKIHSEAVPLIGGIAVFSAAVLSLLLNNNSWENITEIKVFIIGAATLLLIGAIDDRLDISATLKLTIQLALAHFTFANGIAIESMHGIFGIYELPYWIQYALTIIVITGVVNAFNLMDGIDGLAATLGILSFVAFTYLAFLLGNTFLCTLYLALIGALLAFLRFNLSEKQKIFMGDAGSLFLGFILVVSAISMLQIAPTISQSKLVITTIIGVLALPVIDSLRVYRGRIKKGNSPFQADKTHLHHLVLLFGKSHKFSSLLILFICLIILATSLCVGHFLGINYAIIALLLVFAAFVSFLSLNKAVKVWRKKIQQLEN